MITNDVQYQSTKAHLARFDEAVANLSASAGRKPSKLQRLEIDAVTAQADDLRREIEEYERLAAGEVSTFEASSLAGVATLLIKARIARGWTQRRLADELGVAEQQVQRYESTEYRSASLARSATSPPRLTSTSSRRRTCAAQALPDRRRVTFPDSESDVPDLAGTAAGSRSCGGCRD